MLKNKNQTSKENKYKKTKTEKNTYKIVTKKKKKTGDPGNEVIKHDFKIIVINVCKKINCDGEFQ